MILKLVYRLYFRYFVNNGLLKKMGRHGKDLTPEVKKIILDLSNEGYSGHKISQVVGVIPRTVSKFLKHVRERKRGKPPQTRQTEKNGHTR